MILAVTRCRTAAKDEIDMIAQIRGIAVAVAAHEATQQRLG